MTDIIGFNGPPRSGKTATVALLGLWYWRRGYTLLSNFPFYSLRKGRPYPLESRYRLIEPLDLLEMIEEGANYEGFTPLYPNHVLCGQEFQAWLESRLSKSVTQVMMADIPLYFPKMGIKIVYDTQLSSAVDKRLKENAFQRWYCENNLRKPYFKFWELELEETEKNVPTGRTRKIQKAYYQKYVFPYYNTFKITKRLGFDKYMAQIRSEKKLFST